jgi:Flp pilus assembly protein TadG
MSWLRRLTRRKNQRGNAVVEASFIAVPLFGLTFLLLDLTMAQFVKSTIQNAARQGVRYAITGANDVGPCQDDSIKAVVKSNAFGFLNSTSAAATIHVHWINPVTGAVADNSFGNIVGVTVEGLPFAPWAPYQHSAAAVPLYARAYDMMESVPAPLPCISVKE